MASLYLATLPAPSWAQDAVTASPPTAEDAAPASPPPARVPIAAKQSAGRTAQNAVTSADDAFGVAVGREQLGLYSSSSVRGFSPLAAGNARIDGLNFDPVDTPSDRIASSSTIRVGIAAQGYPFAAPTGIVDYQLRHPGSTLSAAASAGATSWGAGSAEVDGNIPIIRDKLAIGLAVIGAHEEYGDGTRDNAVNIGAVLSWKPTDRLEITPFFSGLRIADILQSPIYVVQGEGLPPRLPQRSFDGPFAPEGTVITQVSGVVARLAATPRLKLSLGLFSASSENQLNVSNLRIGVAGSPTFDQLLVVDPPLRTTTWSGELRATREFGRLGRIHLILRGRDRENIYGGSDVIDLGQHRIGDHIDGRAQDFEFGERSSDRVRQLTAGVEYEGNWKGGTVSVGLVKTSYTKTSRAPGLAPVDSHAAPWLLSATAAKRLAGRLSVYGSFIQGLEESPSAPNVAINRGQPVPAIRTRQVDGGVRWAIKPGLTAVVGVFDLEKPYFNLDASSRYRTLGTVRNRGIELSLAGSLTSRLNIVAGSLLQQPRVSGFAVDSSLIGSRPTNLPARLTILNADWRLPGSDAFSVDVALKSFSANPATTSGLTSIPPITTVALGGRYRFRLDGHQAVLRAIVTNVTNERSFTFAGAGAYSGYDGRVGALYLNVDF